MNPPTNAECAQPMARAFGTARRVLALIGLLGVFGAQSFAAAKPPPDEAQAIEQVIRAQVAALAADDAKTAFSFASPAIQRMFGGDAERFMRAVRETYAPVYRPNGLNFVSLQKQGEARVQLVHVSAADGKLWFAYYEMLQVQDHVWRINGCRLVETNALVT